MSCRSPVVRMPSSPNRRGQIQLILGPMFSGKSTELLRRIRRYQIAENQCLVIKYAKDDRYCQDYIATHDMQKIAACKATRLSDIGDTRTYTVIGVDEGQFFPDVAAFCDLMANQGKIVIVAALDGTFERKPFGSILEVIPLAEDVIKLSAVCTGCRNEAAFTKRTTTDQQVELIGGTDKYMAACRQCFNKPIAEKRPLPFKELTNQPACNVNVAAVKALVK